MHALIYCRVSTKDQVQNLSLSTQRKTCREYCERHGYEKRKVNLSTVFAGQKVGVAQVSEHIWLVSFMDYDSGYFDDETCRLEPIEDPFRPKVLPMSPE